MHIWIFTIIFFFINYGIGSFPHSRILTRYGKQRKDFGSKNQIDTIYRIKIFILAFGRWVGGSCLFLNFLKGFLTSFLITAIFVGISFTYPTYPPNWQNVKYDSSYSLLCLLFKWYTKYLLGNNQSICTHSYNIFYQDWDIEEITSYGEYFYAILGILYLCPTLANNLRKSQYNIDNRFFIMLGTFSFLLPVPILITSILTFVVFKYTKNPLIYLNFGAICIPTSLIVQTLFFDSIPVLNFKTNIQRHLIHFWFYLSLLSCILLVIRNIQKNYTKNPSFILDPPF